MNVRVGRILVAAVVAEIAAVLVLVLLVAIFGPNDAVAAQAYAEQLGYWVGPIAGFGACVVGGWWVARGLAASHMLNGTVLGVAVAAIDVAILVASGTAFQLIFVVSNVGRIVAGLFGGWLAARQRT